jgi:hypothetical protein
LKAIEEDRMVNGVEGGSEIKGNKNSGFLRVSGMEDMVKGTEKSGLCEVIAAIS